MPDSPKSFRSSLPHQLHPTPRMAERSPNAREHAAQEEESLDRDMAASDCKDGSAVESKVEEDKQIEAPLVTADEARAERWAKRLEVAKGFLSWAGGHARPVAARMREGSTTAGKALGQGVMVGGAVLGAGIAGVGLLAVGGAVGAGLFAAGGVIVSSGVIGGWVTEKVGQGIGVGIEFAGGVTEGSLRASEAVVGGVKSMLTTSQAELLLGQEGAAVLDHVLQIHRDVQGDLKGVTASQIVKGLVAYACLQRACHASYSSLHYVPPPLAAPGLGEGEIEVLVRHALIAGQTYGAAHNALMGSTGSARDILDGSEAVLCKYLGVEVDDILSKRWETGGPHRPGYILLRDRRCRRLTLAVRGTFHGLDALTDLRCTSGSVRVPSTTGGDSREEEVHLGMWESAVRMDADLSEIVAEHLAPGGACEGYHLTLTGHSLGAAVATLLALRWRGVHPGLRCYAFAPPCCVSGSIAGDVGGFVTSVVLGNDAVCRWSLGSTKDALVAAAALAREAGAIEKCLRAAFLGFSDSPRGGPDAEDLEAMSTSELRSLAVSRSIDVARCEGRDDLVAALIASAPPAPERDEKAGGSFTVTADRSWCETTFKTLDAMMDHDKLYPAGRILWLVPSDDDVPFTVNTVPPETFSRIVLCRRMVSEHIIGNYERALASLLPPERRRDVSEAVESIAAIEKGAEGREEHAVW